MSGLYLRSLTSRLAASGGQSNGRPSSFVIFVIFVVDLIAPFVFVPPFLLM